MGIETSSALLLHESDVFPDDKSKRVSMNDVLARTWSRLSSKT
ncbi:MAG TPA: hypothetical protein VKB55_15705 [Nocardioidaceae bacterium]|nr:hypothetical protein [Nocardioidaceae bacterium]